MTGIREVPKREGFENRLIDATKDRVELFFNMGYRPIIESFDCIDFEHGKAVLATRGVGGGNVGVFMERRIDTHSSQDEFIRILEEEYSHQPSSGMVDGASLKEYTDNRIDDHLRKTNVWRLMWFKVKTYPYKMR